VSVMDISGKIHPFETHLNALYRLAVALVSRISGTILRRII
jgi:hypothetical protein